MKPVIAVLGAAFGLLMLMATVAQASTPVWKVMATPASVGGQQGVSCWAKRGCLSVGNGQAMKWDGRNWTAVSVPTDSVVIAVSCRSSTYCIGVGNVNGQGAAAWSWDGRTWTSQSVYSPSGFYGAALSAVECASRTSCEAVGSTGYDGCSGECGPLAEMWNGTNWVDQPISGGPPNGWLDGVACEKSAGTCEAVGGAPAYTCTGVCVIPPVAWAAGLSGSTWVMQPSMASLYPQASIAGSVSCWSAGCIAVGREGSAIGPSNPGYTFAALWNGSTWSPKGVTGSGEPSGAYFASWSGVHCWSVSRCTAVGAYEPVYAGPNVTLVSTWNGSRWRQVAAPGSSGSELSGLFCTSRRSICVAVGSQSSAALALRN
jgi:hypothetical protein